MTHRCMDCGSDNCCCPSPMEGVRCEQQAASKSWKMTPKHMRYPHKNKFLFDEVYDACRDLSDKDIRKIAKYVRSLNKDAQKIKYP